MTEELKPCPFCGKPARGAYNKAHDVHCVWCDNYEGCVARPEVDRYGTSADEVTAIWNTRPVEDDLRARVAELEAERDKWQYAYRATAEAIPWDDVRAVLDEAASDMPPQITWERAEIFDRLEHWYSLFAPQERTDAQST